MYELPPLDRCLAQTCIACLTYVTPMLSPLLTKDSQIKLLFCRIICPAFSQIMTGNILSGEQWRIQGQRTTHAPPPALLEPKIWFFFLDFCGNSPSARSNYYVFGIIGKLFKNAREWCQFHTCIYSMHMLISDQVSKCGPSFEKSWIHRWQQTTCWARGDPALAHYQIPSVRCLIRRFCVKYELDCRLPIVHSYLHSTLLSALLLNTTQFVLCYEFIKYHQRIDITMFTMHGHARCD